MLILHIIRKLSFRDGVASYPIRFLMMLADELLSKAKREEAERDGSEEEWSDMRRSAACSCLQVTAELRTMYFTIHIAT